MAFSIVCILLVGIIAYFHYVQGLLSGVISATCAVVAALLAFSLHEPIIGMLPPAKLADQLHAMVLVALFALIYLILRVVFDNLVPGNVRFPAIVDKVGGALTGAVAGVFAVGVVAIGAQLLPFGPSIWQYARWEVEDRDVKVPSERGQMQDSLTYEELKQDTLMADNRSGMILPVDDIVVAFVGKQSETGALAGARTFASIHPEYVNEAFYTRLGVQIGAKRVAINTDKQPQATAEKVFFLQQAPMTDAEITEIRNRKLRSPLASNNTKAVLIVRVGFTEHATDSDKFVRLAPASVRLVANGKNFLPEGTFDRGVIFSNKPDDFLIVQPTAPVDFVYYVDREDVLKKGTAPRSADDKDAPTAASLSIRDGVFVEVKRGARTDLSGMQVQEVYEPIESGVQRKARVVEMAKEAGAGEAPVAGTETAGGTAAGGSSSGGGSAPPPGGGLTVGLEQFLHPDKAPFWFQNASNEPKLQIEVSAAKTSGEVESRAGTITLKDKKIAKFELRPFQTVEELQKHEHKFTELFVPDGMRYVTLSGPASGPETKHWLWAEDLGNIEVSDVDDKRYKPVGVLARVKKDNKDYLLGQFDPDNPPTKVDKDLNFTIDVIYVIFAVPADKQLKAAWYKADKLENLEAGKGL